MDMNLVNFIGIAVCVLVILLCLHVTASTKDIKRLEDKIDRFEKEFFYNNNNLDLILERFSQDFREKLDKIDSTVTAINAGIFFYENIYRDRIKRIPLETTREAQLYPNPEWKKKNDMSAARAARKKKREKRLVMQKVSASEAEIRDDHIGL